MKSVCSALHVLAMPHRVFPLPPASRGARPVQDDVGTCPLYARVRSLHPLVSRQMLWSCCHVPIGRPTQSCLEISIEHAIGAAIRRVLLSSRQLRTTSAQHERSMSVPSKLVSRALHFSNKGRGTRVWLMADGQTWVYRTMAARTAPMA